MSNGKGQGGPALAKPTTPRNTALDRELAELEKKRFVAIAPTGHLVVTRAGYAELYRRGLVRNGSRRRS